jgi:hypothetical protein
LTQFSNSTFQFTDSSGDGKNTEQKLQTDSAGANNGGSQIKNKKLLFSTKTLILIISTLLCAILGIILLLVFLIYGSQLQGKQGDYGKNIISDGDDSRKNIPINSTIGNQHRLSVLLTYLFVFIQF